MKSAKQTDKKSLLGQECIQEYHFDIKGNTFDMVPLIKKMYSSSEDLDTESENNPSKWEPGFSAKISASIKNLLMMNGKELNQVNTPMEYRAPYLLSAVLEGQWGQKERLHYRTV